MSESQTRTESKHTPGPWIEDHFQYAGEHQRDIYAELSDGSRVQVAAVAEMLGFRPHWEAEANANLMAAAPDLLEALEKVAGHFLMLATGNMPAESYADDFNAAQAAIARARGEVTA